METEYRNTAGKTAGEVTRDIADFLAMPCILQGKKEVDLANLLPDLNMKEQFSFALLMEACTQGWEADTAERFFRHAVTPHIGEMLTEKMLSLFASPNSHDFGIAVIKYGYGFDLTVPSYWSSCLKLAITAKAIPTLMAYFKMFVICLEEFAYMDGRRPKETYAWNYCKTFEKILDELQKPDLPPSLPVTVRAFGGNSGKKENNAYYISLGVDLENPNKDRAMLDVKIDITLKDKNGQIIDVIGDKISSIDPGAVFHYGITHRVRGASVAGIYAKAHAETYLETDTAEMRGVKIERVGIKHDGQYEILKGTLRSQYDFDLPAFALHYQYLSKDNRILGGGCEWFFDGLKAGDEKQFRMGCAVPLPSATRIVYSLDFDRKLAIGNGRGRP